MGPDAGMFTARKVRHEVRGADGLADKPFDAANTELMNHAADVLQRHYPGHPWFITADIRNGVCTVGLGGFAQWGHLIKISTLKSDPMMRTVIRAGGEMLERFAMPRAGFSLADWKIATRKTPHWFNRNRKPPE